MNINKAISSLAFITAVLWLTSVCFKISHWGYANMLAGASAISFGIFVLAVLSKFGLKAFSAIGSKLDKGIFISLVATAILYATGLFLKINHIQFSEITITLAFCSFGVFAVLFMIDRGRKAYRPGRLMVDKLIFATLCLAIVAWTASVILRINHLYFGDLLLKVSMVSFVALCMLATYKVWNRTLATR